jgi:hypothetical protein
MFFGVLDGIQYITRRSRMVRRIRFIKGKLFFGVQKSFGIFRWKTGKLLEGSGGATYGPTTPGGAT